MQTGEETGISTTLSTALILAGGAVAYAAIVLLVAPGETARFFAWDIQPPATAVFMGAFYATAIPYLFVIGRPGTPWRRVRPVLPTLIALSTTMLVATALHLDRFIWSNPAAWAWAGLYLVYPPATVVLYRRHAQRAPGPERVEVPVVRFLRPAALTGATASAGLGVAFLLAPVAMASLWPWDLTPLTGRVVGGWLLFFAAALAGMGLERDWSSIRLLFPQAALGMTLLLSGVARFRNSFHWERPASWVYVGAVVVALFFTVSIFVLHEQRSRRTLVARPSPVSDGSGA